MARDKYLDGSDCNSCKDKVEMVTKPPCDPKEKMPNVYQNVGSCYEVISTVTSSKIPFTLGLRGRLQITTDGGMLLYHPLAGLLGIIGETEVEGYYQVRQLDSNKSGIEIRKGDCIYIKIAEGFDSSQLGVCLNGQFEVPANGESVPVWLTSNEFGVGDILDFTAQGSTVSKSFKVVRKGSGDGDGLYSYTIQNEGNGGTPGSIVDGGCSTDCFVSVSKSGGLSDCANEVTNTAGGLIACTENGKKVLKPRRSGDVFAADSDLVLTPRQVDLLCCPEITGCLKFSEANGIDTLDTTTLVADVDIDCFKEAFDIAEQSGNKLAVQYEGNVFVVESYNSSTREIAIKPKESTFFQDLGSNVYEIPPNAQLCVTDCCNGCVSNRTTTSVFSGTGLKNPNLVLPEASIDFDTTGATEAVPVEATYFYGVSSGGVPTLIESNPTNLSNGSIVYNANGQPVPPTPAILLNKVCNDQACIKSFKGFYNYQLEYPELPLGVSVGAEIYNLVITSETKLDGSVETIRESSQSPNRPYWVYGPTLQVAEKLGRSIGPGSTPGATKWEPSPAGEFSDSLKLGSFSCLEVSLFLILTVRASADQGVVPFTFKGSLRRQFVTDNSNEVELPEFLDSF